jgi:hypothetical protein
LWSEHYGGDYPEVAYCICPTGDGGFLLAGKSDSFPGGGLRLVRVNALGGVMWAYSYSGQSGIAYEALPTTDGGFVIAGYVETWTNGNDAYVFKVDDAGDPVWARTLGGPNDDFATAICPAGDGGVMVSGYTSSFGAGSWDMYLIKVGSTGDTVWTRTYGGTSFDQAWDITPSIDGNFLLAGHTGSAGAGNADMALVKIDPAGNQIWFRTYGGIDEDKAEAVCSSGDGHYYLVGRTASFTTPAYFDAYVVKVDGTVSSVLPEIPSQFPATFTLHPCRPNPFNPTTTIRYELRVASHVSLKVYNTAGRLVVTLVDGMRQAGMHQATFAGSGLASGIYLAKLQAGEFKAVQKLVLLK